MRSMTEEIAQRQCLTIVNYNARRGVNHHTSLYSPTTPCVRNRYAGLNDRGSSWTRKSRGATALPGINARGSGPAHGCARGGPTLHLGSPGWGLNRPTRKGGPSHQQPIPPWSRSHPLVHVMHSNECFLDFSTACMWAGPPPSSPTGPHWPRRTLGLVILSLRGHPEAPS